MTKADVASKAPEGGWHWIPWLCEYFGTAILVLGGLSAVCLDFGANSPIAAHVPSQSARLLITGLLFAGTGSLVALSPLGRISGAHLNPAVTFAFWTQRKVHPHDLAGYLAAQLLGALCAVVLLRLIWGHTAVGLHLGATQPGHGVSDVGAAGLETLMTASLVLMIFFCTSSRRTARWTPLGNWLLVATLVWQGAPYTGTSLNPARSLAPALVADLYAQARSTANPPTPSGTTSSATSPYARSNSAPAAAPTAPAASTNTPACPARCCAPTRLNRTGSSRSSPTCATA